MLARDLWTCWRLTLQHRPSSASAMDDVPSAPRAKEPAGIAARFKIPGTLEILAAIEKSGNHVPRIILVGHAYGVDRPNGREQVPPRDSLVALGASPRGVNASLIYTT